MTVNPESKSNTNILVEVQPANCRNYLPPNLQLILLDEYEQEIIDTKTTEYNQHIQLDLTGEPGERFSLKIVLEEIIFREHFIV